MDNSNIMIGIQKKKGWDKRLPDSSGVFITHCNHCHMNIFNVNQTKHLSFLWKVFFKFLLEWTKHTNGTGSIVQLTTETQSLPISALQHSCALFWQTSPKVLLSSSLPQTGLIWSENHRTENTQWALSCFWVF